MSCSVMSVVTANGDVEPRIRLSNGSGSAACVWVALLRKYKELIYPNERFNPTPASMFRSPFTEWEDLWKAASPNNPKPLPLQWWEWNVLQWTFDDAMVKREDFELFARSLRLFREALVLPIHVCHLGQIADEIDKVLAAKGGEIALCHYHTSVSEDPWTVQTEDDECVPYNINTGTKHWFVECRGPDFVHAADATQPATEAEAQ